MEEMYSALRGHLTSKLVPLFKIRKYQPDNSVLWLAGIQFASVITLAHISDVYSLVTVQIKEEASMFTGVDI